MWDGYTQRWSKLQTLLFPPGTGGQDASATLGAQPPRNASCERSSHRGLTSCNYTYPALET